MSRSWLMIPAGRALRFARVFALAGLLVLPLLAACAAPTPGWPPARTYAAPVALTAATCTDGVQTSGAKTRICLPDPAALWNKNLVIYAHGYVAPYVPVQIPEDQLHLPDGTYIPDVVTGFPLYYAFATTSYSVNGLAVRQGLADIVDLVSIFRAAHPQLQRVVLVGASEGGLITTLAAEQFPGVFAGGLAACGPIGDFQAHANYISDFRVVFDYFFPGVIPGTAVDIPPTLVPTWDEYYKNTVLPVILAPSSQLSVTQVLSVTKAVVDPLAVQATISQTFASVLWYNVVATNDAILKLDGSPYDNNGRVYSGSLDDVALNLGVGRYSSDPAGTAELQAHYQTAGAPLVPLVTLHTLYDPTVPYWHEVLYRAKVVARHDTPRHDNIPVNRYGHCNFTSNDVQGALLLLLTRVNNPPPFVTVLPLVLK